MNKREVLSIGANGEVVQTHESTLEAGIYHSVTSSAIRYAIYHKQQINGFKIVYADERETYHRNLTRTGALYIDFVLGQSVIWIQQYNLMEPPKISLGVITEMEATECKISLLPTSNNSGFVQKTVKYYELERPKKSNSFFKTDEGFNHQVEGTRRLLIRYLEKGNDFSLNDSVSDLIAKASIIL